MNNNIMSTIKKKLNKLYYEITNKKINWNKINMKKYYKEFNCLLKKNIIFKKLINKYNLEDINLHKNLIRKKFIYIFIFFELLYEDMKKDDNVKLKIFEVNNKKNYSNNFFMNLKRETLNLCYHSNYLFDLLIDDKNLMFENIKFNLGIDMNITEAIIFDLFRGYYKNAYLGTLLILTLPFKCYAIDIKSMKIDDLWLDLYTSWNANFIYTDGPCEGAFPGATICLMNSFKHNKINEWGYNRLYTLYLTTIFELDEDFKYKKTLNKKFLNDWNNLNLEYLSKIKLFHF